MAISQEEKDELKRKVLIETENMFSKITLDFQKMELRDKLYFLMDLEEQRVRSRQPIFPNVASGQTVELPLRQGLFGFQIVDLQ